MTHPTRPATGPVILEHTIHIEDDTQSIRTALEQHIRVMTQRHTEIIAYLNHQAHDTHYYGEELVKAYNRLNIIAGRTERKLDALMRAEQENEREREQAA